MSHLTSLVPVSVENVKTAAEQAKEWIRKVRQQDREASVQALMRSRWHLRFTCKPPFIRRHNHVEAEAVVDRFEWCNGWADWQFTMCGLEDRMIRLLAAAELSTDGNVWLNMEDAFAIKQHLDALSESQ